MVTGEEGGGAAGAGLHVHRANLGRETNTSHRTYRYLTAPLTVLQHEVSQGQDSMQNLRMQGVPLRCGAHLGGAGGVGAGLGGGIWAMGRGSAVIVVGLCAYWVGGTACPPCMQKHEGWLDDAQTSACDSTQVAVGQMGC